VTRIDGMPGDEWERALRANELSLGLDDLVVGTIQGEHAVLLDYTRGEYYGLNSVATVVWRLLRDGKQFGEIVAAVVAEYDVSEAIAARDIAGMLADLRDKGVVIARRV